VRRSTGDRWALECNAFGVGMAEVDGWASSKLANRDCACKIDPMALAGTHIDHG